MAANRIKIIEKLIKGCYGKRWLSTESRFRKNVLDEESKLLVTENEVCCKILKVDCVFLDCPSQKIKLFVVSPFLYFFSLLFVSFKTWPQWGFFPRLEDLKKKIINISSLLPYFQWFSHLEFDFLYGYLHLTGFTVYVVVYWIEKDFKLCG